MTTLRELKEGALLHTLVALLMFNRPARKDEVHRKTGWSDEAIQDALDVLSDPEHNLVLRLPNGRHALWMATARARQLLLPLTEALPLSDDHGPALLQAGQPVAAPDQPDALMVSPLGAESDPSSYSFNESLLRDSIKNNNKKAPVTPLPAESDSHLRHVAEVSKALLTKGAPLPADDDPLPPDLRAAAARLVERGRVPRERAELVVARSPWDAPKILEQLEIWLAYRESPAGANLDEAKFPWLIAARIERGEECPLDTRGAGDVTRFDGYLQYIDREDPEP